MVLRARARARVHAVVFARALELVHRAAAQRQVQGPSVDHPLHHGGERAARRVAGRTALVLGGNGHNAPILRVPLGRRRRKRHGRRSRCVGASAQRVVAHAAPRLGVLVVELARALRQEAVGSARAGAVRAPDEAVGLDLGALASKCRDLEPRRVAGARTLRELAHDLLALGVLDDLAVRVALELELALPLHVLDARRRSARRRKLGGKRRRRRRGGRRGRRGRRYRAELLEGRFDGRVQNGRALREQEGLAGRAGALRLLAVGEAVVVLAARVRAVAAVPAHLVAQRGDRAHAVDELECAELLQQGRADRPVRGAFASRAGADRFGVRNHVVSLPDGPGVLLDARRGRRSPCWVEEARNPAAGRRGRRRGRCDRQHAVGELGVARLERGVHGRLGGRRARRDDDASSFALLVQQRHRAFGEPVHRDVAGARVGGCGPEAVDAGFSGLCDHVAGFQRGPWEGQPARAVRCVVRGLCGDVRGVFVREDPDVFAGAAQLHAERVVVAGHDRVADLLGLDVPRVQARREVLRFASAEVVQQVAASREVGERKGRRALEGDPAALGRGARVRGDRDPFAHRFASLAGDARDAVLVLGLDRMVDQRLVEVLRVLVYALHEAPAVIGVGRDRFGRGARRLHLGDALAEQAFEQRVVLSERGDHALRLVDGVRELVRVVLCFGGGLVRARELRVAIDPLLLLEREVPLGTLQPPERRRRRWRRADHASEARLRRLALLREPLQKQAGRPVLDVRGVGVLARRVDAEEGRRRHGEARLGARVVRRWKAWRVWRRGWLWPVEECPWRRTRWGRRVRGEHIVTMPPFAVSIDESGRALERLLDHAAAERVLLAPGVWQRGQARVEARALREYGEGVASFEELDFDQPAFHGAVRVSGVEAVEADDVRVELRDRHDRVEVVLQL